MRTDRRYSELVRNIGLFALSDVSTKLVTFIMVPLYTYFLSEAEYGVTDMATISLALALPLVTLSVTESVLRFCISDRGNQGDYVTLGTIIVLLSNLVVAVALPLLDLSFFGGLGAYKWYFLLCYFGLSSQTLLSSIARGLDQVKLMSIAAICSALVNVTSSIILVGALKQGVTGFFAANLIGSLVCCSTIVCGGRYWRILHRPAKGFGQRLHGMLAYSLPLIPNALTWWINQSINRFFITVSFGIGASGMFAAALKIPALLNLISAVFMQAWNLTAFKAREAAEATRLFSEIFIVYNAAMAMATSVLIPLSPLFAGLLLQKSFYSGWTVIPVSMLAFYYSTSGAFYGSVYTANMKTKNLFLTTLAGALVCIGATYVLLQLFGLIGAAYGTAIANLVVWLLRLVDTRRIIKIRLPVPSLIMTNLLLVLSAVLLSSGVPYGMQISIACSFLVVLTQCLALRDVSRGEKSEIAGGDDAVVLKK